MLDSDIKQKGLSKFIPILSWLPGYPRENFSFDIVAGLSETAVNQRRVAIPIWGCNPPI
jgi:hypothetical protein